MIDFRYHLVSLISVFLALAVGIVLGAGPLKEAIGDTLSGEVEALRARAADLRTELDDTQADLAVQHEAFAAVAPELLDAVMPERRVAVVTLGDIAPEVVESVRERLRQGGAEVTAVVQVTDQWMDPTRRAYRQSLAGTLVDYLDPTPAQNAGTATELAEALAQSLTTSDPEDPDAFSEDARVVLGVLVEAELVALEEEATVPADAFVVLVEPADVPQPADASATPEPADPDVLAAREALVGTSVQIAVAAQLRSLGVVVGGGEVVEDGVFDRLRGESLPSRVSTVESVDTVVGQVSVVLALSARMGGNPGHFGRSSDATALVPPRVVLQPIVRVPFQGPTVEDGAEGGENGAGDGADDGSDASGTEGDAAG